jgi:hypothetical protein
MSKISLSLIVVITGLLMACSEPYQPKPFKELNRDPNKDDFHDIVSQAIAFDPPIHPFLNPAGLNSMHADAYNSDVHDVAVNFSADKEIHIKTRIGNAFLGGQCATLTFRQDGLIQAICAGALGFHIQLIEPRSLNMLADYSMPTRPSTYEALVHWDRSKVMLDSSGAYFFIDQNDHVWIANSEHKILELNAQKSGDTYHYLEVNSWDISSAVDHDCLRPTNPLPSGKCDPITGLLNDYQDTLWWISRFGKVGTLNKNTGEIQTLDLNEEIQNGFAVAQEGVYIVSDHALYLFTQDETQSPKIVWREAYDRGQTSKLGSINQGSGTTPTIFGDYITITDNADERINLVIYRRQAEDNRLVCKVPLFDINSSATENSMIALNNSVVIENNAGFSNAHQHTDYSTVGKGVTRIDVAEDGQSCSVVWNKPIAVPSVVPKLASKSGIVFVYSFETQPNNTNDWYLVGLDFSSGNEVFRIHTGNGKDYNNNFSPITLGPDQTVYIGTSKGLIALWQ